MKKQTKAIIGGFLCAGVLAAVLQTYGAWAFITMDYGESSSNSHTDAEIRQAAGCVYSAFRDYSGCVMKHLEYDEAATQNAADWYVGCPVYVPEGEQPTGEKYDDVIVLNSSFKTSKIFSDPSWCGMDQNGWSWTIGHTPENGWKLLGSGYA